MRYLPGTEEQQPYNVQDLISIDIRQRNWSTNKTSKDQKGFLRKSQSQSLLHLIITINNYSMALVQKRIENSHKSLQWLMTEDSLPVPSYVRTYDLPFAFIASLFNNLITAPGFQAINFGLQCNQTRLVSYSRTRPLPDLEPATKIWLQWY